MLTKCKFFKGYLLTVYFYLRVMPGRKSYRVIIVVAVFALTGLLAVQVYWFVTTYRVQEQQFDNQVNIALRDVSDKLLKLSSNGTGRLNPIVQTASNVFHVDLNSPIDYQALDSLLKLTFAEHNVLVPFEVAIYDDQLTTLLLGNFYSHGVSSKPNPTCLEREPVKANMDLIVTFPSKTRDIIGSIRIWTFSAVTFAGILVLFAFMIIDLSRQKKLAEMKADFINNMTHEFQTPLTNISLAAEILSHATNQMDQTKIKQYAHIIHNENHRLKHHVEQVLQTALLDNREFELKKETVNMNTLLEEVTHNFQVRIQKRQGSIITDLKAHSPNIIADYFHLTNVMYSLLDNADKYSLENLAITISTKNEGNNVLVSIADMGVGIRKDVQRYIFDKFYRAPSGNVHNIKGFGLGLTYVQKIVQAHQGTVSVTSAIDKGSVFSLYFPSCSCTR